MQKQQGALSFGAMTAIGGGLLVLAIIGAGMASYISANNYGAAVEARLKAKQDDNRNIFAQYGQKIVEIAQVPEMYKNDLKEVVVGAIEGRYGENGSQATWQWIQEQNPTIDTGIYAKIQQTIVAGRDEFKNGQTGMLDIKRSYETSLGYFWKGMWLRIAGFPKINLDAYRIVSTQRADKAFDTGREDAPIKLR